MIIALLILLPLFASLLVFTGKFRKNSKQVALIFSLVNFAVTLVVGYLFAFAENHILSMGLNLKQLLDIDIILRLDAVSLILVMLTNLLVPVIIASTDKREGKNYMFYAQILLMQMALIGVFTASEMILFYIFLGVGIDSDFLYHSHLGRRKSSENKCEVSDIYHCRQFCYADCHLVSLHVNSRTTYLQF
jgi:NADH:ubiquinone oxidoreductase subunit 4 (subunit M)